MQEKERFRSIVRDLRYKMNLSQKEFGVLFEPSVKQQSVSLWEAGCTIPSPKHWLKLADLLGMDLENFYRYLGVNSTSSQKFCFIVRNVRKKINLSQKEFGVLFEPPVKQQSVASWESGLTIPSRSRLSKLANLLDIDVESLLILGRRQFQ